MASLKLGRPAGNGWLVFAHPTHETAAMTDHSPIADEFVTANRAFAVDFDDADLQVEPTRHVTVVACMDSRMDMFQLLGLGHGEAHVIRNAGGVITDDVDQGCACFLGVM